MFAVTDIETSGRDPWRNEILTFTTILADKNFKEVDRFNGKIKPKYTNQWEEEAERVHGINKKVAKTFDSSVDVLNSFISFLDSFSTDEFRFVCHALPFKSRIDLFDRNFFFAWFWNNNRRADYYRLFPESKIHSTIIRKHKEARNNWKIENQKLSTWIKKLKIKNGNHHESSFDAEVCLKILEYQSTSQGVLNG